MQDEMRIAIENSVSLFLRRDSDLLELDAHEQAISHRVALYLEAHFTNQHIDCEYNKHLDKPKEMKVEMINLQEAQSCGCNACRNIVLGKLNLIEEINFRPDIVVHARNTDGHNTLVIEIKKLKDCPFDKAKLIALTKKPGEYEYKFGVYICFSDGKPEYTWYVEGNEYIPHL